MRILITGGSGDLGQTLSMLSPAGGIELESYDMQRPRSSSMSWTAGDIFNRTTLECAQKRCAITVHLVSCNEACEPGRERGAYDLWDLIVTGTFNILEGALRAGQQGVVMITNPSLDEPNSIVGHTTGVAELVCEEYARRHGLSVVVLRPRDFAPPWDRVRYPQFIDWARRFFCGGVHIIDVAQAIFRAVRFIDLAERGCFHALPVDGREDFSVSDLERWDDDGPGTTFARVFPDLEPLSLRFGINTAVRPSMFHRYATTSVIGYRPRYGVRSLFEDLVRHGERGPTGPEAYADLLSQLTFISEEAPEFGTMVAQFP